MRDEKTAATQTSGIGSDDSQRGIDRDGGIDGIAAGSQDIHPDFGREGMVRSDGAVLVPPCMAGRSCVLRVRVTCLAGGEGAQARAIEPQQCESCDELSSIQWSQHDRPPNIKILHNARFFLRVQLEFMDTPSNHTERPDSLQRDGSREVWNSGFCSLMVMQFAGAMNDNILRSLISVSVAIGGIWAATKVGTTVGTPVVGLCLTIPFLLFSGWGGQIADRYSKRTLMIILKAIETPCALLALFAFAFESVNLALLTLVLIATQSAFYGPVKYGVIAELVDRRRLGPANGWISMSTQIAIVTGSLIGAIVSELYAPQGKTYDLVWVPGIFIIFFALLGLAPTFFIPRLTAKEPDLRVGWNPFATYLPSLRDMAKGPILGVALAWAGFWLIGMISLSALPDLQKALAPAGESLSPVRAIALVSVLGLFSGIGSALCGWLSRDGVKAIHVPLGAAGMTVFFFLIGIVPVKFWLLAGLAAGGGFCAGFYLIPLWTLIQARAPEGERGRYLGTANAISFAFMTVGAILYAVWTKVLGFGVSEVFLFNSALAFIGCLIFVIRRHRLAGWVQEA